MRAFTRFLESIFETFLFNSRLIVILAVVGSLTSSVLMFVRGAILIVHSAKDFFHHWKDPHGDDLSIALISSVDSFLFATVLLIFAMGIYELFISKIDPASRQADSRPNWLQIHSLDDLKGAVGKVILMILIVRLFESAVKMKYDAPLHLLYLGLAILFVAAALYLQHLAHKHDKPHAADHGDAKPRGAHEGDDDDPHKDDHALIAPAPIQTMPQGIPVQPKPEPPPQPYVQPPYAAPLPMQPFASQPPPPMQQHPNGPPMQPMQPVQPVQPPMQTMQSPYGPPNAPQQQPQWNQAPPSGPNGPRRW